MKKLQRNLGITKLQSKILFKGICAVIQELKSFQSNQQFWSNTHYNHTEENSEKILHEESKEDNQCMNESITHIADEEILNKEQEIVQKIDKVKEEPLVVKCDLLMSELSQNK